MNTNTVCKKHESISKKSIFFCRNEENIFEKLRKNEVIEWVKL